MSVRKELYPGGRWIDIKKMGMNAGRGDGVKGEKRDDGKKKEQGNMGKRRKQKVEEEVARKRRKGRETGRTRSSPNSPSIFGREAQRVSDSHGPGEGWKDCSAEPLVPLGPQACLLQGHYSWCLLP